MRDQSLIIRSIAEYEAESRGEHRAAPRSVPRRPLGGTFRDMPFTVLQLSTEGMRIRHDAQLLEGETAEIALALPSPAPVVTMQAQVAWTSMGERSVSGLRVLDGAALRQALDHLSRAGELLPDEGDRGTSPLGNLTDEDVAAILRAARRADPRTDEVTSVWESLDRRLDKGKVESVVTWLRRARETAAEAQRAL